MKKLFLIVCLMTPFVVNGQQSIAIPAMSYQFKFPSLQDTKYLHTHHAFVSLQPSSLAYLNASHHLPGMFCKIENRIGIKSKLAPRFRLGSLNYTEWMEGKRDLYSRYWK